MSTTVNYSPENICTCGAHPGGACGCDSSRCDGGTPFIGDDGSLWIRLSGSLTDAQRAENQAFAREHNAR